MENFNLSIRQTHNLDEILILNALIFPEDELDVSINTSHWVARDKHSGKPVGFCSVSDIGQGVLFLSRSGLLREYRGRNTQRKFIAIRERYARRHGFECIITYTLKDNYQSFSSLIKKGYELYDPEYDYVGGDVFYFRKKL